VNFFLKMFHHFPYPLPILGFKSGISIKFAHICFSEPKKQWKQKFWLINKFIITCLDASSQFQCSQSRRKQKKIIKTKRKEPNEWKKYVFHFSSAYVFCENVVKHKIINAEEKKIQSTAGWARKGANDGMQASNRVFNYSNFCFRIFYCPPPLVHPTVRFYSLFWQPTAGHPIYC
jgi:hypothetical protein